MSTISERFKEIRITLGLNQAQFAKKAEINPSLVSDVERGDKEPSKNVIVALIKTYHINSNYLLAGIGEMFKKNENKEDLLSASIPDGKIPILRQTVSCGPGQEWADADMIDEYMDLSNSFPSFKIANIRGLRTRGMSMVGAGIFDGDIVLFDANKHDVFFDNIYVFALNGSVYCKWLKFESLNRKIQIYSLHRSDIEKAELIKELNTDNNDEISQFRIFGPVLAWMHENRVVYH